MAVGGARAGTRDGAARLKIQENQSDRKINGAYVRFWNKAFGKLCSNYVRSVG